MQQQPGSEKIENLACFDHALLGNASSMAAATFLLITLG